ncbi:MAG: PQQ-binding-like beta-propeller repeat protein [Myxococcales bacterium]|nr:PQQ-binding-like beta-propeller repeat protein [Myxococcales bacterium]
MQAKWKVSHLVASCAALSLASCQQDSAQPGVDLSGASMSPAGSSTPGASGADARTAGQQPSTDGNVPVDSASAGTGADATDPSEPPVPGAPEGRGHAVWGSFGLDLGHSRFNREETSITRETVSRLGQAWTVSAPGVTSTPVVRDRIIYWADWGGTVHATTLQGVELWSYLSTDPAMGYTPSGYTASLFAGEELVYAANRDGWLVALDRADGSERWKTLIDGGMHTHIWSSPVVAEDDNVLVIGVAGYGTRNDGTPLPSEQLRGFKGAVHGYAASTGALLWSFDTTSDGGSSGVSVWSSASLDTERKLAFIGTGNAYSRPAGPYSDSLLFINYMTGELVHHAQYTEGDAFTVATPLSGPDADVPGAPNLFMIGDVPAVGVGQKNGYYHVHHRETGALIWEEQLTSGGTQGGIMQSAAYGDGTIYVASNSGFSSSALFAVDAADGRVKWRHSFGDKTFAPPALIGGVVFSGDISGSVAALDAASGDVLWELDVRQDHGAGFSVAHGLLLTGFGYHFSELSQEPLSGGLFAYSVDGAPPVVGEADPNDDCDPTHVASGNTFEDVYQSVLCTGCATAGCHSAMSPIVGLPLQPIDAAYTALVSQPAAAASAGGVCAGRTQVVPGDADASLLYTKLVQTGGGNACGARMPLVADPLDSALTERVRAWIEAGASR